MARLENLPGGFFYPNLDLDLYLLNEGQSSCGAASSFSLFTVWVLNGVVTILPLR